MPDAQLRVRIYDIDWTLASPGPLDNSNLHKVPVLRIFGDSSSGLKACVHIHQVYPYFFVEYPSRDKLDAYEVRQYSAKLHHSLNKAISLSMKKRPDARHQYVRAVVLVKGNHFYGFHSSYSPFLKIHFTDPSVVSRAAAILQIGTVLSTKFRVFEAHLSWPLQFMCDFALYGCAWIDMDDVWQRETNPTVFTQMEPDLAPLDKLLFKASSYFGTTQMPLEVDVSAPHIMNRHRVAARNMHHELKIPGSSLSSEPLVLSVRELWEDERRRRTARGVNPSPKMPVDPSESARSKGSEWVSELEHWEQIKRRIQSEGRYTPLQAGRWERSVMTAFESIEALWDPADKTWRPLPLYDTTATTEELVSGDSSRDIQADELDLDGDEEDEDSHVNEGLLATQTVTRLIAETENPEWQAQAQVQQQAQDYIMDDLLDDDPLDFEDESGASSTHATPRRHPETLHSARNKRRAATSVPTSQSKTGRDTKSLSPRKQHAIGESFEESSHTPARKSQMLTTYMQSPLAQRAPTVSRFSPGQSSVLLDSSENSFLDDGNEPTCKADLDKTKESAKKKRRVHKGGDEIHGGYATPRPSINLAPLVYTLSASRPERSQHILSQLRPVTSYAYAPSPPRASELLATIEDHGLPRRVYRAPWYSNPDDAPDAAREYAGLVYHLKGGDGLDTLANWQNHPDITALSSFSRTAWTPHDAWEYMGQPPSSRETRSWLLRFGNTVQDAEPSKRTWRSQIPGPTARPRYMQPVGFKYGVPATREKQSMTTLSLEVFALSQGEYKPNSETDSIAAVFYTFQDDDAPLDHPSPQVSLREGALLLVCPQFASHRLPGIDVRLLSDELDIMQASIDLVHELDPDVLAGWEVQMGSWGYLRARCRSYGMELEELIARGPARTSHNDNDQWGLRQTSTFKVVGRHMLNVWRIMRSEQTLRAYTFENVADHLLHERFPYYTSATLTRWFRSTIPDQVAHLLRYFHERTRAVIRMLDAAQVVTKTAEFARVFGIDFFSVLSRGSQYKVESFMFKLAKPESFVLLSPSKADVGKQNAIECMPLIMEPASAFYSSPLVVLDFASLYPSLMIAYNLCYSTCLGRVRKFKDTNKFGVTELNLPDGLLGELQDHIHVAPNGIMYVKPTVRNGLLGRMLRELLQTRVMVKQAMKGVKDDKALRRVLESRQLALKFISNVTYGYTSATYSGRMPAVEIADSIVQSGRETLEKAIRVIRSTEKWGAKVVYGDTDSLFIYMPGKTKEQAFRIGHDIADTITAMNPAPVKLKFEKVYLPCVLMAKKRYVGWKYENPDDDPVFEAKGIETVRRDGCVAQAKMVEQCLKILFRTQDLSAVKGYCYDAWYKIIDQRVTVQDFIFAKEVKMGTYSDKNVPAPGVTVAARRELVDPNDEVQYGERVSYVIVRGAPGTKLLERAYDPREVVTDSQKHIDAHYYISRVLIPPLERIFNLMGADVRAWYDDMPQAVRADGAALSPRKVHALANARALAGHFHHAQCILCGAAAAAGLCHACRARSARAASAAALGEHVRAREERLRRAHAICGTCAGIAPAQAVPCESLDCAWFFERHKAGAGMELAGFASELLEELAGMGEDEDGREVAEEGEQSAVEIGLEFEEISESEA